MAAPLNRRSRQLSLQESKNHPDFQIAWVQAVLDQPGIQVIAELPPNWTDEMVSNTMFNYTLSHETGIKARILLRRPCSEADSSTGMEDLYILSVGTGLEGKTGRAHGGLTSIVLDHLLGTTAHRECPAGDPPATAYLHVDYKNPVSTPAVILARSWLTEITGRKVFVRGQVEDGQGKVYAMGKSLFVNARTTPKSSL